MWKVCIFVSKEKKQQQKNPKQANNEYSFKIEISNYELLN